MQSSEFAELIGRQRPGWCLEQPFYTSEEIYERERRGWLAKQWHLLAHCSELRESGAYIVRDLLGESLLIVRDEDATVRGFYNVCRHRGSRICDQDGRGQSFTCPYHAWSYRLDGSLKTATALPDGIDIARLGLHPVEVCEIGGLIWGSLQGNLQALDAMRQEFDPGLRYFGIPQARIAARQTYTYNGNWKLVMENAFECYHCFPAHPEYCSVMKWVDWIARVAPDGGAGWEQIVDKWLKEEADPDSPLRLSRDAWASMDSHVNMDYIAYRMPIGEGRKTLSQDGMPVAPLLGQQGRFDGGVSTFSIWPLSFVSAVSDYAVMFQFLPTGVESTDVVVTWLVDASARDTNVEVERMKWFWHTTTYQDETIVARNAEGVRSRAFSPGPYSTLETVTAQFVARYLREQSALCGAK